MKKVLYLILVLIVLAACSQSPEQKAEVLIKDSLKKSLYKPDTYKPVDTKVDSAFTPYDDPKVTFTIITPNVGTGDINFGQMSSVNKRIAQKISKKYFEIYK